MMKHVLNQLFAHQKLSENEAREVLLHISKGVYNDAQIAAFISVYLMRGIGVDELNGFRKALLDLCVPVDLGGAITIDVCGTGGDGKNTFNISTLSAFVIAGAGYKVSKHGNYGVSSFCGSSNILEYFGYQFTADTDALRRQLDQSNICLLHAPLFHPAMKSVGPIRKQLGVKTFFNLLGPLVNPANPSRQLVGVFNLKVCRLYQFLLEKDDKNYCLVHSTDGYDEVSLTAPTKIVTNGTESIVTSSFFGFPQCRAEDIHGGRDMKDAARIFMRVLNNESQGPPRQVILANAALGIRCFEPAKSIEDCLAEAARSIDSGAAKHCFKKSIELSQKAYA